MTLVEAREKVDGIVADLGKAVDGGLVVLEDRTLTRPYGWVFLYTGRRHLETGDPTHAVAGNGPIIVLAENGEVIQLGTARRPAEEIEHFERARGFHHTDQG